MKRVIKITCIKNVDINVYQIRNNQVIELLVILINNYPKIITLTTLTTLKLLLNCTWISFVPRLGDILYI